MDKMSDKEIINILNFTDNYEIAYRIKELKKENIKLKKENTRLKKYKELSVSQWISVNDRLPENETDVAFIARSRDFLGSGSYRMKFIGYYDDNFFSNQENYIGDVTYWMPLPSAPEASE